MSKVRNTNSIMEHRIERHTVPNSKPKRRRAATFEDVESNMENTIIQFNMLGLVGAIAMFFTPMTIGMQLLFAGLFIMGGISCWTNEE